VIEAIVGVALRAILASVLLGAVLSGLVLIATRRLALTAATRHALWTTAMIATAAMPLAGIAVSLARATPAAAQPAAALPSGAAARVAARRGVEPSLRRMLRSEAITPVRPSSAVSSGATAAAAAAPVLPLGPATWTPRLTRALAIGIVAVWSLGALIGLIGLAASVVRIRGLKRRSSPLDGALADELPWLTATGPGREIYLRLSYEIETPVAIGFGRPLILIPTELTGEGGLAALEPLVLHEHAHLRRYDDWTNLVQRTIERVFWFNPIVWLVGRRIALEREIASDDAVVEKTGEAHAYATSLWRLAREMRMPEHAVVAPGALLTRKQIAVRIEQLLDANRGRRHGSPATALATVLAGIGAVAFVATSAPAIELPATPEPPVTAVAGAMRTHATPKTPPRIVQRPAHPASSTATLHVTPQHLAAQGSGAAVHPRTVIVYVPVPAKSAPAMDVAPKRVAMASPGREPQQAAIPAPPAIPQAPESVPAPPPLPGPGAPTLSPRTLATIRSIAGHGSARAAALGTQIGLEVAGSVGQALAHLPREIAQLDTDDGIHVNHRVVPSGAKLSRELLASCNGCSFRGADLHGMDLHGIALKGDDFNGADLRGVNLAGASLIGVSLRDANLSNADLRGAHLTGVELRGASLSGADLDGVTMTGISLRSPGVTGVSMRSMLARCTACDLAHTDLHGQDLHGISLTGADLSHADLHGANLSGAHLLGVDFSGADLSGADLTNARLDGCALRGVSLHDAITTGMTAHGSSLDG
jgi:uncharacterized protein YjbI with pentapeptide repeats/beta-lactamase regulating signal transducer with metallopeptidase domain